MGEKFIMIRTPYRRKNATDITLEEYLHIFCTTNQMYSWEDMPKDIPSYMIEYFLFAYGNCVLFKEFGHYWALRVAKEKQLDSYGRMVGAQPIALNSTHFSRVYVRDEFDSKGQLTHKQNAVLIKNNLLDCPTSFFVVNTLIRLNYIWQSIGIAEAQIRSRRVYHCEDPDQKNILTMEMNNLTDGVNPISVIYDKSPIAGKFEDLSAQANGEELKNLWYDFDKCKNRLLSLLGIHNNPDNGKMERQITDEVTSNKEEVDLNRAGMLEFRQMALEEARSIFGDDFKNSLVVPYSDHANVEMNKWYNKKDPNAALNQNNDPNDPNNRDNKS